MIEEGKGSRGRVLVVDDEVATRSGLEKLLQLEGFSTEAASDGRGALEIAAVRPPDLVVTDINMPVMDGVELLGRLRSARPGIPIIATSAFSSALGRAMNAGADEALMKPIDFDFLTSSIVRLLQR
jgi:two-component system response regulator HydG